MSQDGATTSFIHNLANFVVVVLLVHNVGHICWRSNCSIKHQAPHYFQRQHLKAYRWDYQSSAKVGRFCNVCTGKNNDDVSFLKFFLGAPFNNIHQNIRAGNVPTFMFHKRIYIDRKRIQIFVQIRR